MSEEIKTIDTEYDGYRFRSRLQAKWAVFFNTVGLSINMNWKDMKWMIQDIFLIFMFLVSIDGLKLRETNEYQGNKEV